MLITEDQFIERFKPEESEPGCYYRQRDWCNPEDLVEIRRADAERRLWTATDDGEHWGLTNGFHYVNRQYYVICAVPVPEGEDYEVDDDDEPDDDEQELDAEEQRDGTD